MRTFILLALLSFLAFTVVMAVIFRDRRAKERLRFVLKLGWIYVAVVVGLAVWRLYGDRW